MKKILFIAYNGLTLEILNYFKEFNISIFDIKVIVPIKLDLYGQQINFDTANKLKNIKYIPLNLATQPYIFFNSIENNYQLDKILKNFKPHLIIIHNELFHPNSIAVINSKLRNSSNFKILNFIATQYLPSRFDYFRNYFYYNKIIKHTDFLCCRNKKELNKLRKIKLLKNIKLFQNYWGSSHNLFYKIYKSKNEIILNNTYLKSLLNIINNKNILLGFIGRMVEEKGLHLIIEALEHLPNNYYLVYSGQFGSEYYRDFINAKIEKHCLKNRCIYLGNINYEKLVYLYNILDLVIVPTNLGKINFIELFGRVIPEVMLCKTLIIGSDNGSISEIINNNKLIFKQNNSKSLKNKILEVVSLSNFKKNEVIEKNYIYALNNYTSKRYVVRLQDFILNNL